MASKTKDELLADLTTNVRSGGAGGLTTAAGLRALLTDVIEALPGTSGNALTAPGGQRYLLTVDNAGVLHAAPADGQAVAPEELLTAPNGLIYRLVVADDGTLSTIPASGLMDPDAAAFIEAAGLQHGGQQEALNALVQALKAHTIWPSLHALYPMIGGTEQAHALNLKDPRDADAAFRLTFVGSPRHTERGVEWDGSQYANTHYYPPQHLSPNSNHLAYYAVTDNTSGTQGELGSYQGGNYFALALQVGGKTYYESVRSGQFSAPVLNGKGFGLGNRESSDTVALYRDGQRLQVSVNGGVEPATDYPDAPLWLGARQDNLFSQKVCGLASFGEGLTAEQAVAYAAAVATFQQALGRAVALDADASAFLQAAGITDLAQQQAVDALVRALKAGGIWEQLHAAYPMVGGTERAHALNLKDPRDLDNAFRLTFYNSPAHTARGVEWDGSTQYADSHYYPSQHLAANNHHLAYYALTDVDANGPISIEIGCLDNNNYSLSMLVRYQGQGNGSYLESCGLFQWSTFVPNGLGFTLDCRESDTNLRFYRDGQLLPLASAGFTVAAAGSPVAPVMLAHRRDGYYSSRACGFASVGGSLTPEQAVAYSAAVRAFQQALKREVF